MNSVDLEHRLLKGSPIFFDGIGVYQITLGDMVDFEYSYTMCNHVINLLCMDDEKVPETHIFEDKRSVLTFAIIQMYSELNDMENGNINEKEIGDLLVVTLPPFLEMLFRENVKIDFENFRFIIGDDENEKYLSEENYDSFRSILKKRNCLVDIDGESNDDNPDNDIAKKMLEKRKMLREKLKKAKLRSGDDDEGLTMCDLVSIFAEAENMPLCDVYDKYDVYQFNNQFNRLKIMEDYQVNIKALLAGAKNEDVKLQHWLSKIKKQDN